MSRWLTLTDAARALASGATTSTEVTRQCLDRISAASALGAFVHVAEESAMSSAATADAEIAAGRRRGPLHGIPLAIKDVFATHDAPTTANSRAIELGWGAGTDAVVVARLRAAGAVVLGKATTNEFACGPPDPATGFPIPVNPWHADHNPDGSSSGSAIAVSAGLACGALGTDSGGSIRGPAAANGITGLKPTYGLLPRDGMFPLSDTLDTIGPMARSAQDCAVLLAAMTETQPAPLQGDLSGVRVGVVRRGSLAPADLAPEALAAIDTCAEALEQAGAELVPAELDEVDLAELAVQVIVAAEGFARHRDRLRTHWAEYGVHTRHFLATGASVSAVDYLAAQRFRARLRREVARVFDRVDVLVTPSSQAPAAPLTVRRERSGGIEHNLDAPWNLTGLPAVAIPAGFSRDGLPLSVQLVARPFAEQLLLAVAGAFQAVTDWHLRQPPGHAW